MKRLASIILLLVAVLVQHGCINDFSEGADISFRSVKSRMTGAWKLDGVWVNGIDSTGMEPYASLKGDLTFDFQNNGWKEEEIIYISYSNRYIEGTWTTTELNRYRDSRFTVRTNPKSDDVSKLRAVGIDQSYFIKCCRKDRLVLESRDPNRFFKNLNFKILFVRK